MIIVAGYRKPALDAANFCCVIPDVGGLCPGAVNLDNFEVPGHQTDRIFVANIDSTKIKVRNFVHYFFTELYNAGE